MLCLARQLLVTGTMGGVSLYQKEEVQSVKDQYGCFFVKQRFK